MAKAASPIPTASELAILRVLWDLGPSTVREVFDRMNEHRPSGSKPMGYTTVLKFLQIMNDKRLVVRDDARRTHVYRPAPGAVEPQMQRRLIKDLLDRAFHGSMGKFMTHALSAGRASSQELVEIRKALDAAKA